MASIDGLVDEWDSCASLREQLRQKHALFLPLEGDQSVVATVACAEVNFEALKPLAARLQHPPGTVGMFTIPDLTRANL